MVLYCMQAKEVQCQCFSGFHGLFFQKARKQAHKEQKNPACLSCSGEQPHPGPPPILLFLIIFFLLSFSFS